MWQGHIAASSSSVKILFHSTHHGYTAVTKSRATYTGKSSATCIDIVCVWLQ